MRIGELARSVDVNVETIRYFQRIGLLQTVTLDVQNLTCAVCPITVKKALERVLGVTEAKVDFAKKTASISFDSDKTSPDALTKATADTGYPSVVHK